SGPANGVGVVEAHVRAELARIMGIPATAIITETTALTTREEARRLSALLQPRGIQRILLVTDATHMPRSLRLFEQAGFVVHSAPVDELTLAGSPESRLKLMRLLAQELLARLYYRVAGYL
ncbi:MAG TPA: YdcF family protein, partial [Gammaproteobacteria bacterium]|nr:YdcF family protein [Gammaproteobacteria bacterium]